MGRIIRKARPIIGNLRLPTIATVKKPEQFHHGCIENGLTGLVVCTPLICVHVRGFHLTKGVVNQVNRFNCILIYFSNSENQELNSKQIAGLYFTGRTCYTNKHE